MADKSSSTENAKNKYDELGVTGLYQASGYIFDEFQKELVGDRGRKTYREMKDTDDTVGALLTAIEMILRSAELEVIPAEGDASGEYADFITQCFNDMEDTWDNTLDEILTMLAFGFSILEIVLKRRIGPDQEFQDGRIGIAKLAPRAQETIFRWELSPNGDVLGLFQTPVTTPEVYIPAEKFLHFKTKLNKGNPEGRSILRNAYRNWYYIKNIQMIEAIAIERELNGFPVLYVPAANLGDEQKRAQYTKIVRDIKMNNQGGLVLSSETWPDNMGKPSNVRQYELTLLSTEGSRAIDTDKVIKRHQQGITRSMLADFLLLGSTDKGSYALSKDKSDLFLRSIKSISENITAVINRKLIPLLAKLNGFDPKMMPCVKLGKFSPVDLEELGNYVDKIGGIGVPLNDPDAINFLRGEGGLPELTEEGLQAIEDKNLAEREAEASAALALVEAKNNSGGGENDDQQIETD